jgi:phosphatidylinositol alpha-mannosyltransferase
VLAHVEALADELRGRGHEVRVLAPVDPDDRLARVLHRGSAPTPRELPPAGEFVPLGRTLGLPANGAVSTLTYSPNTAVAMGRELRSGWYDVLHVHEPNAAVVPWYTIENAPMPVVGTFHAYATKPVPMAIGNLAGQRRLFNKLSLRIAVSEAARWTGERFYGGRYRIIPNGIDLTRARSGPKPQNDRLELLFVGRAEERKGLPVLMRAFEALRAASVDAHLTVAGATAEEVAPLLLETEGVDIVGRVSEDEKWRLLHNADLLCAPSLGGESFGIVLLEALASGTPVVCSDIPGYRDVVRDDVEGRLVPPGDPAALGEAIRALALRRGHREELAVAARARRALRVAARGRRGRTGLRGRARRPGARDAPGPHRRRGRDQAGRWRAALARPSPAHARAGRAAADLPHLAPRGHRRRSAARGRARPAGRAPDRAAEDRRCAAERHAHVDGGRPGADVPVDDGPRGGLARDPARRDAGRARPPARRRARDDDRRPDVGDVARPPG